jgi:23S rRNA (uracil1939-C5)-methyltransferase
MESSFDIRIEKLVYGGDALAHHDGRTVFVPYAIGGELERVRAVEQKKKFVRAKIDQVLEPAADRVAAPCPQFGVCGGCHYQHMNYAAQVRSKSQILRETLSRIGRINWTGEIGENVAQPLQYRNRAQWALRPVGSAGKLAIGYFQQGSSTLAPATVCPIIAPRLESVLAGLGRACDEGALPRSVRAIEAFVNSTGDQLILNVSADKSAIAAEKLLPRLIPFTGEIVSLLVQDESTENLDLAGPGHIVYESGGRKFRVGHLSFFQVNRFLIDELTRAVVGDVKGELALDLFAGVGLFSLPLAANFKRVIAVEGNVAAVRDLELNLKDIPMARARHSEVESFLARWKETPELVVLDPPRAGISDVAAKRLREIGAATIVYLSCDPATLARDLAVLTRKEEVGHNYRINTLELYDLFPETYHIEALATLQRLE